MGGLSGDIQDKILKSLKASGIQDLVGLLDKFDTSKVNLNTLMVNVSDGGQDLNSAITEASKVSLPTDSNPIDEVVKPDVDVKEEFSDVIPTPTAVPTVVPTPIVTPSPTLIVMPTPTPIPTVMPTPTPIPTVMPTPTPIPTVMPTPTPVPTVAPTQSTAQTFKSTLKKTGQTTSYEQFDDGEYQTGVTPSYSRSGEIVTDNITKLQWQDNEEAKTVEKSWEDAKSYCLALSLGGKSDWRLPTRKELKSIVDYGKVNPAIYSVFQNVTSNGYWSSTTDVSDSSDAWGVLFNVGDDYWFSKTNEYRVRCVRGGQ